MMTLLLAAAAVAQPEVRAFAVLVGNNAPAGPGLANLRFADDDAARYAELFQTVGTETEVLSVLDADSQALHPEVAARARPPDRESLSRTLDQTFDRIEAARADGYRTVFYFVFVGHGSVEDDGQGHMHLLGGTFRRSDLFREVIGASPADVNHVIIDACNAYLMVARRGADAQRRMDAALADFLASEDLSRHPDTGVFVATARATEVHEWERFGAGVFSHELRSAMAGAADVDGDGAVAYDEAEAFIAAANANVRQPKARLQVYAQAPAIHLDEPLFDTSAAGSVVPRLRIPGSMSGRYWLEDARGVRFADFHSSPESELNLLLVPSRTYYLQSSDREYKLVTEVSTDLDASRVPSSPVTLASRGAEAESFRRDLFTIPFGRSYYEGYAASVAAEPWSSATLVQPRNQTVRHWVAGSVIGTGLAAMAVSVGFLVSSGDLAEDHRTFIGDSDDVDDLANRSLAHSTVGQVLLGSGSALVVGGLTTLLWPSRR